MTELKQNLPKLGPYHSALNERQMQLVKLIKSGDVNLELKTAINQDIPGLRKKRIPFSVTPSTQRWVKPFTSIERNGVVNWGLARNWARFAFPILPLFWMFYIMQPTLHGTVYRQQFNNYQWESTYLKLTTVRPPPMEQSITRIA